VPARWTLALLLLAVAARSCGLRRALADYQLARFRAFTDPNLDVQGAAA
jgi:cell division protein FtsW (lipid II flippase)